MVSSVDLSNIDYLFNKGKHLKLKRCNLIFGKNASGKSSIANEINNQYGKDHPDKNTDVFLFNKDFINNNIAKDDQLNALSLGTKDVKTHKKLVKLASKINSSKSIKSNYNKNYYSNKEICLKYKSDKRKWLTACARDLRNNHITLVNANYNKNDFYNDLKNNSKFLSKEVIHKLERTIHEPIKNKIHIKNAIPNIKINNILKDVNNLLALQVRSKHINSLSGITNKAKKKFAVEGMRIHNQDEICAFCGNKITSNRWMKLHELFNSQYFHLISKIRNYINILMNYESKISQINELDVKSFYLNYQNKVKSINYWIIRLSLNYNNFFNYLIRLLNRKKDNINKVYRISSNSKQVTDLKSFDTLKSDICEIVKKNNDYGNQMNSVKNKARKLILSSLIASKKRKFMSNNPKFNIEFHDAKNNFNKSYKKLININNHLAHLYGVKHTLLQKDQDKNIIVKSINKYLDFLGDNSFRLYYDDSFNGEYYVSSKKDGRRGINTLSRGELNLISFLYFYYLISPNNPDNKDSNNKVVILDDPMDSNDVDFQYLMITLLQELIHRINDKINKPEKGQNKGDYKYRLFRKYQLIIFTHNVNFYLNVKYSISKKKLNLIHLFRTSKGTGIQYITNNTQDFCNSYQELWAETEYLYNQKQADFMINPIRRIVETFIKFNAISKDTFYKGHEYAKKLFNVNSHDVDDASTNSNGHSCDSIKHMFKELFYDNGSKKHFDNCWNMFKDYGKK